MYIDHALINALSTHMIHINLNVMFYPHQVEHSPTKTTHTKQDAERPPPHTHTHTHPTHTQTTMNLNVYDTDLYHTPYMHIFLLV